MNMEGRRCLIASSVIRPLCSAKNGLDSTSSIRGKLGIRAGNVGSIRLENVAVPDENRLGEEGEGFRTAMSALDNGRFGIQNAGTNGTVITGNRISYNGGPWGATPYGASLLGLGRGIAVTNSDGLVVFDNRHIARPHSARRQQGNSARQ